jgi:hypothetical protein
MINLDETLKGSYLKQVSALYEQLSNSILTAGENDSAIEEAEERFKNGLSHAKSVHERAKRLAADSMLGG